MTSTDHAIEVSELRRRYGPAGQRGFEAVRGVSFSVARGELFALLGTNGAGKTSALEVVEGLSPPDAGEVRVLGHDPYRERARVRPRVGVMLQAGGFPGELTVAETLRMWAGCTSGVRAGAGGSPGGRRASRARAEGSAAAEALDSVGLAGRRDVRVKQLSGGERRRLDLALALLGRPDVLFLDEPSTGLDAEGRRDTWELVRTLRDNGTTVLLTTHYLEEAEQLADQLAIMHQGQITASGTVAEIVGRQPTHLSFELPDGYTPSDLPPSAETGVLDHELDGRLVRLHTRDLQRTTTRLLLWAERNDVRLHRLDARSASLEEAFLTIAADLGTRQAAPAGRPTATSTGGCHTEGDTR